MRDSLDWPASSPRLRDACGEATSQYGRPVKATEAESDCSGDGVKSIPVRCTFMLS